MPCYCFFVNISFVINKSRRRHRILDDVKPQIAFFLHLTQVILVENTKESGYFFSISVNFYQLDVHHCSSQCGSCYRRKRG